MVCRDFILPEFCKPRLFLSSIQFAQLILHYLSALKKKLRRECNLRSVNLRCSKACKPNSNSNALSIRSLDDVALDYDGAIKTYTGSGTDLVIGMEGAALYASSPHALEVLLGEALAKTWANRYNKNTDIVL